jgi:hypothetical protein
VTREETYQFKRSLALVGVGSLLLGAIFYAHLRPSALPIFSWLRVDGLWVLLNENVDLPACIRHNLPTLLHVLGFSALTALLFPLRYRFALGIPLAWLGINIGFEWLQLTPNILSPSLPEEVLGLPLARFATHGTFDPNDLHAGVLGALLSVCLLACGRPRTRSLEISPVTVRRFAAAPLILLGLVSIVATSPIQPTYNLPGAACIINSDCMGPEKCRQQVCSFPPATRAVPELIPGVMNCVNAGMDHTGLRVSDIVYLSYEELRNSFAVDAPRPIKKGGKIYVYGDMLFINERNQGIHVVDNSDPKVPRQLSFLNIPGNIDIAVKGQTLYADSFVDLVVLDISNLDQIRAVNRINDTFPYNPSQAIPEQDPYFCWQGWSHADSSQGIPVGIKTEAGGQ